MEQQGRLPASCGYTTIERLCMWPSKAPVRGLPKSKCLTAGQASSKTSNAAAKVGIGLSAMKWPLRPASSFDDNSSPLNTTAMHRLLAVLARD